jgi:hypothetical protein
MLAHVNHYLASQDRFASMPCTAVLLPQKFAAAAVLVILLVLELSHSTVELLRYRIKLKSRQICQHAVELLQYLKKEPDDGFQPKPVI